MLPEGLKRAVNALDSRLFVETVKEKTYFIYIFSLKKLTTSQNKKK